MRTFLRFGDNGESLSVDLNGTEKTFFSGPYNQQRMDLIRETIVHIRSNWISYKTIPIEVEKLLTALFSEQEPLNECLSIVQAAHQANRFWADRSNFDFKNYDYPLLKYYTSEQGYRSLFSAINFRYRQVFDNETWKDFFASTWIIELINMELFAHSIHKPEIVETDTIYRGVVFENKYKAEYARFGETELPHEERMASIPLGLYSSSSDIGIARRFVENDLRGEYDPVNHLSGKFDHFSTVWHIDICRLSDAQLMMYHKYFPSSVVSGICATDISGYSKYDEKEVLLRGPFFEIIDCVPEEPISGLDAFSMHAVMVDNNRDHISTYELGERNADARKLFNALIRWQKYQRCVEISDKLNNRDLRSGYLELAEKAEAETYTISNAL